MYVFLDNKYINFGFWPHVGCSRENAIVCTPYLAMKVSYRVSREEIKK